MSLPKRKYTAAELISGQTYRVIKAFRDFDRITHPVGETWRFIEKNFLPYDDGLSLFVERNGQRIQYRASDTGQLKKCTLSVEQFFQRFLQHVLPHAFVKVRYYGFFGAAVRRKLTALQLRPSRLVHDSVRDSVEHQAASAPSAQDTPSKILCPTCGLPMTFQRNLSPEQCRSP